MPPSEPGLVERECRLAHRLARLFRIDRTGVLGRRGPEVAHRLRRRRGDVIEALIRADDARRRSQAPVTPALRSAVEELWRETAATRDQTEATLNRLHAELARARGQGLPSGIRGAAAGRIIARG